jgi:hypothetical protein
LKFEIRQDKKLVRPISKIIWCGGSHCYLSYSGDRGRRILVHG